MSDDSLERSDILQELVATGKWSLGSARLGERANYCCEYCGVNLLATPDTFKLWQIDHIVPLSSAGDPTDFDNLAVSCKPCNWDFKAKWDPRSIAGATANREQLLEAVCSYVRQRRAATEKELTTIRGIVQPRTNEESQ